MDEIQLKEKSQIFSEMLKNLHTLEHLYHATQIKKLQMFCEMYVEENRIFFKIVNNRK